MSNRNPINKSATEEFFCFKCASEPNARSHFLSKALLVASTFLAVSILPMSGAQASADATLSDAQRISLSEARLDRRTMYGNSNSLAMIVEPEKPKKERTPPDGGDGDKPKRPPVEKRAVVSVHG